MGTEELGQKIVETILLSFTRADRTRKRNMKSRELKRKEERSARALLLLRNTKLGTLTPKVAKTKKLLRVWKGNNISQE